MESIDECFLKYDTDKSSRFHNYSRQYEDLFLKFRDKPIKYLEIGVLNGGSINAAREIFKNAETILGLDINNECKKYENLTKNMYVEIGDATNKQFISNIINKYGTFDVILDDGSHINRDMIKTFESFFPSLNDNGIYVIEDTITYKYKHYNDLSYPTILNYIFNYTKFLNQCRQSDSVNGIKDWCVDPFKINKKTQNVFEQSIDKIEYGCSYIAVHKKIRTNWI
uniref:Methyltransferase domain-containing protein n=1 Tax=viral metagenome TaxID=1070528 RepID=A0A6C0BTC6_9ZZZZ